MPWCPPAFEPSCRCATSGPDRAPPPCPTPPQAFTDHYYATFDSNRANLVGLYQDQSLLTFEGQKFQGAQQV